MKLNVIPFHNIWSPDLNFICYYYFQFLASALFLGLDVLVSELYTQAEIFNKVNNIGDSHDLFVLLQKDENACAKLRKYMKTVSV